MQGDVFVETEEGVVYTLRFGEVVFASGEELSAERTWFPARTGVSDAAERRPQVARQPSSRVRASSRATSMIMSSWPPTSPSSPQRRRISCVGTL